MDYFSFKSVCSPYHFFMSLWFSFIKASSSITFSSFTTAVLSTYHAQQKSNTSHAALELRSDVLRKRPDFVMEQNDPIVFDNKTALSIHY